ncbi:plant self-incompatibility S1 [Artemisia annua]|uniref:S-protein homolog n=1 Tax=Artemisia annua TaxID=35608 RepID=A0A2U1QBM1_ARTAN|nr:plant self-incompatibility S1 [Artemisia annua]
MPDNDVIVHVKSGDEDRGIHTIPFNGTFEWSFCDSFLRRALYFADFSCGSKTQSLHLFDDPIAKICDVQKLGTEQCYWSLWFESGCNRLEMPLDHDVEASCFYSSIKSLRFRDRIMCLRRLGNGYGLIGLTCGRCQIRPGCVMFVFYCNVINMELDQRSVVDQLM